MKVWEQVIKDNLASFHDVAIDRIETGRDEISFFLWGVEDHNYDPDYFRRHQPPLGKVILRFSGISKLDGLPPDQYINKDLSRMRVQPQVHHNNRESPGVYKIDVVQSGTDLFNIWTIHIHAQHVLLERCIEN
jgi:hypothetical protein